MTPGPRAGGFLCAVQTQAKLRQHRIGVGPDGTRRLGAAKPRVVFGPTCDSLDRLPDGLPLPEDAQTGDYLLFGGMGAYSIAMSTAFNGYGLAGITLVSDLGAAPQRKAA